MATLTLPAPRREPVEQFPPVLMVTQYYRPELIGSAPYCSDIAEWLSACEVPVSALTTRPHYPDNEVFAGYRLGERDVEVIRGVQVTRVPTWAPGGGALHRLAASGYFVAQGLLRLVGRRVPRHDVVLSLCPSILGVLLGALSTRRGGRHVVLVHDIESGLAQGLGLLGKGVLVGMLRALERFVLNRATDVLVLSEDMAEKLVAAGVRAPISVLPIWIDIEEIRPLPPRTTGQFTLLYSGNFGRKQGLNQVLDLAERLMGVAPEVRIVLRGGGREAAVIHDDVLKRGLANVEFEALSPPERFNEGLASGDLHLVPQNPNGADFAVPSKIYGIMAAGRPFIATALPGSLLWRLQERSGAFLCVPPEDPDAFAHAALMLIKDEGLRAAMGERGRNYAVAHHSKSAVLGRLMVQLRQPLAA